MSFLTDDDVNKRARNLFPALATAAPTVDGVTIVAAQADMTYFATYAADVPGVIAITGLWDPAQSGANVTLSGADSVADISAIGTTVGTVNNTTDSVACEFVIGNNTNISVGYYVAGLAPPYDANDYAGGSGTFSTYYEPDGDIISFAGGSVGNPPLATGDVVGVVYNNGAGTVSFYIDGVLISNTASPSNSNMRPMASRP